MSSAVARAAAALACSLLTVSAFAAEPASPPADVPTAMVPAPPQTATVEPLALEVGKPVEIVCTTKAVNVAEEAKVSEGALRLKLESKSATGSDAAASWSVVSVDATHPASFAFIQRESCASACPLDLATERGPTLWGPVKTMPDKLEAGKSLSLAAIDAKTWQIRISIYRDRQIASLEQGECKKAP